VHPAGTRILVVDDEFSIVESLREILTWEGYDVATASNGRQALEAIAHARPALVVLDVMMPILDGLAALKALRADPSTIDLPVILMSAAPLRRGPPVGTYQAFLRKPFEVSALLQEIRRLVRPDPAPAPPAAA
jgi:CheY-like chemotaxis protein